MIMDFYTEKNMGVFDHDGQWIDMRYAREVFYRAWIRDTADLIEVETRTLEDSKAKKINGLLDKIRHYADELVECALSTTK